MQSSAPLSIPISDEKTVYLKKKSIFYRKSLLKIIFNAKAGHTGGSLSCVDILNVLYNHVMNISPENFSDVNRDHYVHSKGHSVEALYAILAEKGFFPADALDRVEKYGSDLIGHPTRNVPGVEQNTGALGHGLSFAVGMALAARMNHTNNRIFTLMGDGELAEGSIWEAAASAAHYRLDNLVAIVDRNNLQISGRTEMVMAMEPLEDKFKAFGFSVCSVDGNSIPDLIHVFEKVPFETGKPNLILAHTVKGKGVSFIEDKVDWHHHVPTEAEFATAMLELDQAQSAMGD